MTVPRDTGRLAEMGTRSEGNGNRRIMVEGTLIGFGLAVLSGVGVAAAWLVVTIIPWSGLLGVILAALSGFLPFLAPTASALVSAMACLYGFWCDAPPKLGGVRSAWSLSAFSATVSAAVSGVVVSLFLPIASENTSSSAESVLYLTIIVVALAFFALAFGMIARLTSFSGFKLRQVLADASVEDALAGAS